MSGTPVCRVAGAVVLRHVVTRTDTGALALSAPSSQSTLDIAAELAATLDRVGHISHLSIAERYELRGGWLSNRHREVAIVVERTLQRLMDSGEGQWSCIAIAAPHELTDLTQWGSVEPSAPTPDHDLNRECQIDERIDHPVGPPDEPVLVHARASLRPSADPLADSLFCFLYGGVPSSRLQQALRDDTGLAYYVASSIGPGVFDIAARCPRQDSGAVTAAMAHAMDSMRTISAAEVAAGRAYFLQRARRSRCSPMHIATDLVAPPGEANPYSALSEMVTALEDPEPDDVERAAAISGRYSFSDFRTVTMPVRHRTQIQTIDTETPAQ